MAILSNSVFLDVGVLLLTLLSAAYLYLSRNYRKWENKEVPFLKPLPFVGNFKDILLGKTNLGELFQKAYNIGKGKPAVGVFAFDQPMLVIRDLDIVKNVLVKDFNYFVDRNIGIDKNADPLNARSLFASKGQHWRYLRMKLTPTFTSGKVKRMFVFVNECGKELIKYAEKYSDDGQLGVKDAMSRYNTDVIASCAFGIQGNALRERDNEFLQILRSVLDFGFVKGMKFAIGFTAPSISLGLKLKITDDNTAQYIRNIVWDTMEHRKKNNIVRNDFLDLLTELKEKETEGKAVNNGELPSLEVKFGDDFVSQAFAFMTAGVETSMTTMSFALYELALHPQYQTRLRHEIQSVLDKNGGELTYEGIQEMSYMDMVLAETMRKYPALPFLDRKALQPYTLPGTNVQLDKGDTIIISLLGIHYDPQYYPNPHSFNPERFTEENKKLRPNYTHMPFGEGPRFCIGMRLGLVQMKVGLAHFLSQFEVSPCEGTTVPMVYDLSK